MPVREGEEERRSLHELPVRVEVGRCDWRQQRWEGVDLLGNNKQS